MIDHLEILETFVRQTGQERGSVSGEMAQESLELLKENIEKIIRANESMYAELATIRERTEQLEKACEAANKAMSCYDEYPGATTTQALRDSFWRLRRVLESIGYRYANDNLDWRGSILHELNDAGFFPNSANAYEDGSRFVYDPTADKDTPARVFGNATGPTLAEVVERWKRAEEILEQAAPAILAEHERNES